MLSASKHAAELGDSEVIRLANIGLDAHAFGSNFQSVLRGNIFKVIAAMPNSDELKELLKNVATSYLGTGDNAIDWALSEMARRGYKDLLPYLFAVDLVRKSIPIFGGRELVSAGPDYRRIETLAGFGEDILPFLEPIVKHNKSALVRIDAMHLIFRIGGKKAVDLLALAMDDPAEENVRLSAGRELASRGELEALKTKLKSDRPEVRRAAIFAFRDYEDKVSVYPLIISYARNDRDESVRAEAHRLIEAICAMNPNFCSDKLIGKTVKTPAR